MTGSERCDCCKYWERLQANGDDSWGHCRRYAPSPVQRTDLMAIWPMTWGNQWCGDWCAGTPKIAATPDGSGGRISGAFKT